MASPEELEGKERNNGILYTSGIYRIRILQTRGGHIRISDSCRKDEDMGCTCVTVLHAWYTCYGMHELAGNRM